MNELIDLLSNAHIFSTLDVNSGYWPVETDLQDRKKSAFTKKYGLYPFRKLPFGQ